MSPNIHDILRSQRKAVTRQQHQEWRKDHLFDIIQARTSIAAIIISIFALIISIIALTQ